MVLENVNPKQKAHMKEFVASAAMRNARFCKHARIVFELSLIRRRESHSDAISLVLIGFTK